MSQIKSLRTGIKFKDTPIGKIPVDWEALALSQVTEINMGQSPSSQDCHDYEEGLPFYQGNSDFGSKYPTVRRWCKKPSKVAKEGDILISVRAPVGEINIAPHECCIGRGLGAIRATKINSDYLYQSMLFHRKALEKVSQGSTFEAINRKDLSDFMIFAPSINEQNRIAEILTTVDDAIEETDRIIEKTKELKKGLMQKLLTRGIGHKKFKKTEIGEIPEEWEVSKLDNLMSVKHGYAFEGQHFGSKGPVLLTPGNFREDGGLYFNGRNLKRYSGDYPKEFALSPNDLVIVMTDLSPFCKILGNPALIPQGERILHNQRIGKIVFRNKKVDKNFLYYFILSEMFKRVIKSTATGTTVRHTAPNRVLNIKIALPNLSEQKKIAEILNKVDLEIE
ncbi:MAG: restriction endonuclease subunit S, partial [Nitrospirae bacterium]